jgi:putative copper export protein
MIGIRLLLFAVLMLIMGLVAFPLYAFRGAGRDENDIAAELAAIQPWLCGVGLFASFAGLLAITATGLINFEMIVGLERVGSMFRSSYGILLVAKLLLFATMLALAALNRWRLTPALAATDGELSNTVTRDSLALEASTAMGILAVVAMLSMSEP